MCRGRELANGQVQLPCVCLHCSEKHAALLAVRYQGLDESELMKVSVVLPAIGDLRYATREELAALAFFLRETAPNLTNPIAKAA